MDKWSDEGAADEVDEVEDPDECYGEEGCEDEEVGGDEEADADADEDVDADADEDGEGEGDADVDADAEIDGDADADADADVDAEDLDIGADVDAAGGEIDGTVIGGDAKQMTNGRLHGNANAEARRLWHSGAHSVEENSFRVIQDKKAIATLIGQVLKAARKPSVVHMSRYGRALAAGTLTASSGGILPSITSRLDPEGLCSMSARCAYCQIPVPCTVAGREFLTGPTSAIMWFHKECCPS